MNKYFLPVYHSELKPWIKWWILKRLNGGQSSLKAVTISSGTLTKVDKSKALSIKEYYGNTVQDGTPTPESPVEIQTISGNITFNINSVNYSLDLKSKNLFDEKFRQGNRFTVGLTDTTRLFTTQNYPVKSGITYTISTTLDISIYKYGINLSTQPYPIQNVTPSPQFYDSGWQYGASFTFTPSQDGYFGMTIAKLNGSDSLTPSDISSYTWQLEEGSTPTPYESYYDYELCKIGDFKDKIYNDNGTWKVEKNIEKFIINGSEEWFYFSTTSKPLFYLLCENYEINYKQQSGLICYSNYFKGIGQVATFDNIYESGNNNIGFRTTYTRLCIRDDRFTVPSALKNWLTTHNTNLYYVKSTASTETITNTNLISQLNALYEFYVNSSTVTISNDSEIPLEVLLEYYGR